MEGIEPGCWRFLVAAVYDCRISASSGSRKAPLQEACGAARRECSRSAVIDRHYSGAPLFAYFFFAFFAAGFFLEPDFLLVAFLALPGFFFEGLLALVFFAFLNLFEESSELDTL